jgi:hypothetical protein
MIVGCLSLIARPSAVFAQANNVDLQKEVDDLKKRLSDVEKGLNNNPPRTEANAAPADDTTVPQTKSAPFDFADFTWLNGNSRVSKPLVDNKYFTGQFMVDVNYVYDYNHPKDHTLDGSCETGRTNEIQVQQLGIGGDLHYGQIRGRVMTQFGMYSQMTPRNDASPSRGQWLNSGNGYQYLSEAYGGYHWDAMHGVNLDAGIFMSYVGLFSYYQNENWAYQPSYVSANTPWFFNGLRLQMFPTETLKIEPWLINGWQSYGMFNSQPGVGAQILWRPYGWLEVLSNDYEGYDTLGNIERMRIHTDDSVEVKYYDAPHNIVDKAAFSLTFDAGCENGGGVSCGGGSSGKAGPAQYFLGFMFYDRTWFDNDKFGLTLGGGAITNPGRYLVLVPPINGATATSGAAPYYTANPGDQFKAWDYSITFDYMPKQYITWRAEFDHRASDEAYFAGNGGMTPPGGNQGGPGSFVAGWTPDLRRSENRINLAMLIRL